MRPRIGSIGIKVLDYARAVSFYRDTLGFPVARSFEDRDDRKAVFFDVGAVTFHIVWEQPKEGEKAPSGSNRARVDLTVADIQSVWEKISSRVPDANGPPHPTRFGGFGFSIHDPEGTTIHILQDKSS